MGQFWKFLLASCLGVFLAIVLISIIGISVISGLISSVDKPPRVEANSVLHLTFKNQIPEKTNNVELAPFSFNQDKIVGLQDMLRMLEKAKDDDDIKGVLIETDAVSTGIATASVLRKAIADFKSDGKFVYAYCEYCSQGTYYLASAADQAFVNPQGIVDFTGFAAQIPFVKNMLDKIGVKIEVFYAGKFKSATEPFRRTEMSPENKLQTREYIEDAYRVF